MRQVGEAELRFTLSMALKRIKPALRNQMASSNDSTRLPAQQRMVDLLMDAMKRYEVMVDAPPYPGDDTAWQPNGKAD